MSPTRDVIAIRYGTVTTTRGDSFYRYQAYGETDRAIQMDFFFWVVRTRDETVLVDTGFDPVVGAARGRKCLVEPLEALARLGILASDVSQVIVSHFHYDHIGNLAAFPNATVIVQRRELEFWTGSLADRLHFAQVVEVKEIGLFERLGKEGRLRIVDGDAEVGAGLKLKLVGGHCPGEQLVLVDGTQRLVVLASDALHLYEEMDKDRPFSLFSDLTEMYVAYETLREFEREGAGIVAGHDPDIMRRLPNIVEEGTEFAVRIC